jgi:hypothetical protein
MLTPFFMFSIDHCTGSGPGGLTREVRCVQTMTPTKPKATTTAAAADDAALDQEAEHALSWVERAKRNHLPVAAPAESDTAATPGEPPSSTASPL